MLHGGTFQRSFSSMTSIFIYKFTSSRHGRLNNHYRLISTQSRISCKSLLIHTLILRHIVFVLQILYSFYYLTTPDPTCAPFNTSSTTHADAGSRSLMDRMDNCFESADKLKRNALALLARSHSEITMSSLGARDPARIACGSRSYIRRYQTAG